MTQLVLRYKNNLQREVQYHWTIALHKTNAVYCNQKMLYLTTVRLTNHSSGVKNNNETQDVLSKANELLLMFEKKIPME